MSRHIDEQPQDVLAMIRETLQHVDAMLADRSRDQASDHVRIWHAALYGEPPSKDDPAPWGRQACELEEQFAGARSARMRNMQLALANTAAIYEQQITKVETQVLNVIRAMNRVTEHVEAELRELQQGGSEARQTYLKTKLAEALVEISKLRETVAADCKGILDLPTNCDATPEDR